MKLMYKQKYLWFALLIAICLIPYSSKAVTIASTPCDAQYYKTLAARAWLEAQREITQNQNIILKPDSVFQYTCFDSLLNELADHASQMFSETSAFGAPLSSTSMDNALQRLVGAALLPYITSNFNYGNLLSGHSAAAVINHPISSISGGSYNCSIMGRVWKAAKCINMIHYNNYDGFYTFQEYATSSDKRHLPTACPAIGGKWTSNINTALTSGPWTNDPLVTYISETTPNSCSGSTCPCTGDPIPTGVKVKKKNITTLFDEKVCLQPGCRYHPGGFPLYKGGPSPGAGCYGR